MLIFFCYFSEFFRIFLIFFLYQKDIRKYSYLHSHSRSSLVWDSSWKRAFNWSILLDNLETFFNVFDMSLIVPNFSVSMKYNY